MTRRSRKMTLMCLTGNVYYDLLLHDLDYNYINHNNQTMSDVLSFQQRVSKIAIKIVLRIKIRIFFSVECLRKSISKGLDREGLENYSFSEGLKKEFFPRRHGEGFFLQGLGEGFFFLRYLATRQGWLNHRFFIIMYF